MDERRELRGTRLDERYELHDVLGIGGTAVVFASTRLADQHQVVVKVLRPMFVDNPDLCRRLRREAEVWNVVRHPGLVPVLDQGTLPDGSPYIVLERVRGECMQRLLRRVGTLPPDLVGAIAMRVASVLHAAHSHGYVHRDVKPEHILLDRDEAGSLRVRLLDFGVCASATAPTDERDREIGRVFGTPSYVSPEQASGDPDVDARADVFGLGIVMYEALTGRLPFTATNVANLLRRIIREDAPRAMLHRPELARTFDQAIATAMARDPDSRFPTMRSLSRALVPLVSGRADVDRRLAAILRFETDVTAGSATVRDLKIAAA
jgi:serine/threonine-protein kinase